MINVLYVNGASFVGGAQITLRNIVRRLDPARFRALVAVPEANVALRSFLADSGISPITLPLLPLRPLGIASLKGLGRTILALKHLVKSENIHVIHTNSQRGAAIGLALQRVTPARFVWTINDVALLRRVSLLIPYADCVTCVSNAVRKRLPQSVNARLIYNGVEVDDEIAANAEAIRIEGRRTLGLPENAFVVGCVTRLERWKGVHNCVAAMRQVMLYEPRAWFVHVGGEPVPSDGYGTRLRTSQANDGRMVFVGYQENPQRWYPIFDALIHMPTTGQFGHTEAFGMNVAEAMGYGLPVVVTAVGAMPELVAESETGFLVADNDVEAASAAIQRLMNDADLGHSVGRAARDRQRKMFTQEREVKDFEHLYEELCGLPSGS
jgi:glycosyltransferase involved in cell wall biosynthesis